MVQSIKHRIGINKTYLLLSIITVLILGAFTSWRLAIKTGNDMREQFLHEAHQIASTISPHYIETLTGSEQDVYLPQYQRLKSQLKATILSNPDQRFVYLIAQKSTDAKSSENSPVVILIDSESPNSKDYSPPGQIYTEVSSEYLDVFNSKRATIVGPITNRWGKWITALVPLNKVATENFDLLLGVDIDAEKWRNQIIRRSLLPTGLTTLALVNVLLIGFNWMARIKQSQKNAYALWFSPEAVMFIAFGIVISIFFAWLVYYDSEKKQYETFQQMVESRIVIFEDELDDLWQVELEGIARFYQGSEYVTTEEFIQYTGYLTKNKFVKAWMWAQVVPKSELNTFKETELVMNGAEIKIWDNDFSENLIHVSNRDYIYPITRIAPKNIDALALGFDVGSNSKRYKAITEALETGLITSSHLVNANTTGEDLLPLLIIRPVLVNVHNKFSRGLVLALLDIDSLFKTEFYEKEIVAILTYVDHSKGEAQLVDSNANKRVIQRFVFAFGKNILITAYLTPEFSASNPIIDAVFIAFIGVVIFLLIAAIMTFIRRRQQQLEVLVQKRTSALKASQEHLSATLKSIGDGVITCDQLGRITSLNHVAETLTGWSSHEASEQAVANVFTIIDSRTRETVENPVKYVLQKGVAVDLSNHVILISRTGDEYYIADSCAPIRNDSNIVIGAVLVFRDVTQVYMHQEVLREERERLQKILKITGTGINIVDSEYNLLYVDAGTIERLGDPTNKKCHEYFKGQKEPCENCNIQKAIETKNIFVSEQNCHQGSDKMYEVHTIPFQNSDGVWLAAEFKIDISQRKKAEEDLKQQRLLLRTLIDNLPAIIYVKDINARKIISNITDYTNLGFDKEEDVIGKTDIEIHSSAETKLYYEDDLRVLIKGEHILDKEESFVKSDGEKVWLSTSKIPIFDENRKVIGLVGIGHDITQKKSTKEELIIAKSKAEESDRLKTAFLQNMSHEIRTPLNAICGFSNMLTEPGITDEKLKSFVAIISNSSQQLLSIVNDVLTISAIETKQEGLHFQLVDINELIDELHAVFMLQIGDKNIDLKVKKNLLDNKAQIQTDKTKLIQILTNLLSNALKFTSNGSIEFGYVHKKNDNKDVMEFFVKDSGVGIPVEYHDLIFERFRQADESINQLHGGAGLGLSISKGFVNLMKGEMWVESEPGNGATFYFTIPM